MFKMFKRSTHLLHIHMSIFQWLHCNLNQSIRSASYIIRIQIIRYFLKKLVDVIPLNVLATVVYLCHIFMVNMQRDTKLHSQRTDVLIKAYVVTPLTRYTTNKGFWKILSLSLIQFLDYHIQEIPCIHKSTKTSSSILVY